MGSQPSTSKVENQTSNETTNESRRGLFAALYDTFTEEAEAADSQIIKAHEDDDEDPEAEFQSCVREFEMARAEGSFSHLTSFQVSPSSIKSHQNKRS